MRSTGLALVCVAVWLGGLSDAHIYAALDGSTEAENSSWHVASTSHVSLLGTVRSVTTQSISTGAGTPPNNWKATSNLGLPRIPLAFGQYVDFSQNGTAQ